MKRFFTRKTTVLVVVSSCVMMAVSCVNRKYELSEERINTNVTIFQEGLSLPLGSTAPVMLKDLYDKLDPEFKELVQNKDGKYGFSYSGSFDLTDSLAGLKDMIAIDALSIDESFSFDLSGVDLSSVSIDGQKIGVDGINISDMLDIPDFNSSLPTLDQNLQGVSMTLPKLNQSEMNFDLASAVENVEHIVPVVSLGDGFDIPEQIKSRKEYTAEMLYSDLKNHTILNMLGMKLPELRDTYSFEEYSVKVPVKITLPKEIQSVESIKLHEDARFEMILEMLNPFFTAGSFTPHMLINLHDLFHVDGFIQGGEDGGKTEHVGMEHHIRDNFVMSAKNNWKSDHIYHIASLAFNDWKKDETTGLLTLDKEIEITLSGNLELDLDNVKTTLKLLDERGSEPMSLKVDIKFFDFKVDDVVMNIAPISIAKNLEMPFNVSGIQLPDVIKSVDYVEFDVNSPLNVNMSASVPECCKNMDISLKTLSIEFPAGLEIDHNASRDKGEYNSATRTLVYKNVSLTEGLNEAVRIKKLNFADGKLNYNGAVKVSAEALAEGSLSSKELLNQSGTGKIDMNVSVSYAPKLEDYSVTTNDYSYKVDIDPVKFSEKLPDEVGDMPKVLVYFEGSPVIKMNFEYPSSIDGISVVADKAQGLKIFFPSMLKFNSLPSTYNYDASTNSICFNKGQQIPLHVELPIDRLEIAPVYKEGEGYFVEGEMKVEGGVCLESTVINQSTVDALKNGNASVSFSAEIPELKPAVLAMDQYVSSISKSIDFDLGTIEGIPEMIEIKSVDTFELDNVYFNLSVDASAASELLNGVKMSMDFDIQLPTFIKVEGAGEGNVIKITGELNKDCKIEMKPVRVIGLDLSAFDFSKSTIELGSHSISVNGNVNIENLSVDLSELKDDLKVAIKGRLATKDTDLIKIGKVQAKVDCQYEIEQSFDLTSLTESLTESVGDKLDYVIDLNRFHLDLDLKTNLHLPAEVSRLEVTPYKNGVAGEPKKLDNPITLKTNPSGEITHTKIRLSNLESDKHSDPEYNHIVFDVLSLVKELPDSIKLNLKAGTQDGAALVIQPSVDYVLAADYAFELPLELGKEFKIEFNETIGDLPEVLGDVLAYGSLGLTGEVTNSFPLALDLEFQLLDVNGNVVPLAEGAGHQTIKAGNLDGSPSKTELYIVLGIQNGIEIPELDAIKLTFRARSSGAGFAESNSVQVQLSALIPEGVSVDLKNLNSEEQQ